MSSINGMLNDDDDDTDGSEGGGGGGGRSVYGGGVRGLCKLAFNSLNISLIALSMATGSVTLVLPVVCKCEKLPFVSKNYL